jgi:hypothetical protein
MSFVSLAGRIDSTPISATISQRIYAAVNTEDHLRLHAGAKTVALHQHTCYRPIISRNAEGHTLPSGRYQCVSCKLAFETVAVWRGETGPTGSTVRDGPSQADQHLATHLFAGTSLS